MKQKHTWIKYTAAALSLSLLASALALTGTGLPPRDWEETVSRPFFRLVSPLLQNLRQGKDYFRGLQALQAENRRLREQADALRQEAAGASLALGENQRLRSLLGLETASGVLAGSRLLTGSQALAGSRPLAAWVLPRQPDNWQEKYPMDQGTEKGVAPGQWVMDAGGNLVGTVWEAGGSWSTLCLLTDPDFQTAGQGARSEVLGALEGDLSHMARGELAFTCLRPEDPVSLGETVVTFSSEGPGGGLTVGTLTSLEEDPGGLTRTGAVTPAADLTRLGQVFILIPEEQWG